MHWILNHLTKRASTPKGQPRLNPTGSDSKPSVSRDLPAVEGTSHVQNEPAEDRAYVAKPSPLGIERMSLDFGHQPRVTAPDAAVSVPLVGKVPQHEVLERKRSQHIEDALQGAIQRGDFDNLPGRGKPFPPHVLDPAHDGMLAGTVMLNAGFVPRWVELRQEIERDTAACLAVVTRTERFPPTVNRHLPVDEVCTCIKNIQAKARLYNLIVPALSLQRSLPDLTALEARVRRAAGVDSG